MENKELVKINPTDFGLTEEKATEITKGLAQVLSEREVLVAQYAEIITLEIDDPKTAKRAKEVRLLIKDNRTKGIEKWRKTHKEYYLRGGQFVDAKGNKESAENERMEDALEQIEKHQEILEKERKAKLQTLRLNLISEYIENADKMDLGNMQDDVWDAFYTTKKAEFEAKKEAERQAEIERQRLAEIEKLHNERKETALPYFQFWSEFEKTLNFGEQSESDFNAFVARVQNAKKEYEAEQARIKAENDRLKLEAEKKEEIRNKRDAEMKPFVVLIRDYNKMLNMNEEDYQKELGDIKRGEEERIAFEAREQRKKFAEMERRKSEAISFLKENGFVEKDGKYECEEYPNTIESNGYDLLTSDEELESLKTAVLKTISEHKKEQELIKTKKELQARQEAEDLANKQKIAEEQKAKADAEKLAKAPIKKQLAVWVDNFSIVGSPVINETSTEIEAKFNAFKSWAKLQVENI